MSKVFNFSIVFASSLFISVQSSENSWISQMSGAMLFVSAGNLHHRLLGVVDPNPNKTMSAQIRDGLLMAASAYLVSAPLSCSEDSQKINTYRCFAGVALMAGHLGYRYFNKSESMQRVAPGPIHPGIITQRNSDDTP